MRVQLPNGNVRPLLGEVKRVGELISTPDLGDLRVTGFEGETVLVEAVGPPPVRSLKPWIRQGRTERPGVA